MKKLTKSPLYKHEALDRTYCIQEMLEALVWSHPLVWGNKKLRKQAEKAQTELGKLYQMIGDDNEHH